MHVTLDVVLSVMGNRVGHAEVLAREERLSLSGATTLPEEVTASTLFVTCPDALGHAPIARHVLIVVSQEDAEEPAVLTDASGYASLAVLRTTLSLGEVYAHVCSALLKLSNWDTRMLEAIAAHQDASSVLAIAAERLDNPVALFDSSGALLTYAGDFTGNVSGTIWEDVLENRYSPIEYYTHEEQREIERLVRRPWPFMVRPTRSPAHTNLSRALFVNGQPVGSVGLVDVAAPFTPAQIALVELIADRMRLALTLRLGGSGETDDRTYLLRSLLNNDKVDKTLVARHMTKLGWKAGQPLTLLCLAMPRAIDDETAMHMRLERIGRCLRQGISIVYDNCVVTLCVGIPNEEEAGATRLLHVLEQLDLFGSMSEPYTDPLQSRVAYEQCQLALKAFSGEGERRLVRFSDVFEHVVTKAAYPEIDPRVLCHPSILSLAQQGYRGDVERGKTLVRELYTYLMNGCNAHLSARQLFLHRNTLTYHIEQVETLLGVTLDQLSLSRRLFLISSCLVAMDEGRQNR